MKHCWFGVLALFAAMPVHASVVFAGNYSSQNPPFDPATGDAWSVGSSNNTEIAVEFQDSSPIAYLLTQIEVGGNFSSSDPDSATNPSLNDLIVGLWVSSTNDPNTATELESWSVPPAGGAGNPGITYTVAPTGAVLINPGEYYFVTENLTPDGANTAEWGWAENNLGPPMEIGYWAGYYGTSGSWTYLNNACTNTPCTAANDTSASGTPAFSVSGNPVPEPASWMLLTAGLIFLLVQGRRLQVGDLPH